ncbi:tRNA uridine-5-carboxymethylaminomethyl(34) synthesis GTPase MnmE [Sphingobacteriales bacterium UPWRP_1]|nr:tRNA uridine-5-carboxymethylaminomethyl(34) synthesis GTPase MnmE [Sphingobacteriales bacterium UPWRP_1]
MAFYAAADLNDTIVAPITPPGVGAIGVLRMSGQNAIAICNRVFKGKDLTRQRTHTLHFGNIVDPTGQVIDEVLVSVFKAPHSYTSENTVEVSCHGSPYILQQVMQLFIDGGARLAKPGEFTLRAFLHGKLDLSQAEAVADLIASETEAAHHIAINQMRGGFSGQLQELRAQLIHFASLIELELDFSTEDVEFADRTQLTRLVTQLLTAITQLINSFALGNVIKNGVATVIAGRPNAGKSTLLNALLNEDRAIVSEIAGTTRDTIEETLNINGITFRLIDTAGIREAQDRIEAIGVEKTMQKIAQATLLLYVFDITELSPQQVEKDLQQLHPNHAQLLVIANKIDELNEKAANTYNNFAGMFPPEAYLPLSAKQGQGIATLRNALYQKVTGQNAGSTSAAILQNNIVISNARHAEALQNARQALQQVLQGIELHISGELLAADIRRALAHLASITGADITPDDLLGNIFSKFCIGK